MKRLALFLLIAAAGYTAGAQTITDPTYWDRKQLYSNWLFDYDTVRINRLHIDNQTGIDSTGRIFRYMATTPANGNLLIGTGSGFAIGSLASADGTVTITNGSGTIDLSANITGGDVGGLDPTEILFGAADGSIQQSDSVFVADYLGLGVGFGINIEESAVAYQRIQSAGLSYLFLQGNTSAGVKFQDASGDNVGWQIEYDSANNELTMEDVSDLGTLHLSGGDVQIFEGISATNAIYLNASGFQVTAAESHLSGELGLGLDATPDFDIAINSNSRVEVIGTGYGTSKTIFGARYANGTYASPTAVTNAQDIGEFGFAGYKTSAFSTSATAYMKGVSTETWDDASTGTQLQFATTENGSTGASVALTIDEDRNLQIEKKIEEYNNAAPTDGQILIGNTGTSTFDAATITAGTNITVTNGSGTITIAAPSQPNGRWVPTTGTTVNIDAITYNEALFHQTDSVVNWALSVSVDPTAAGATLTTARVSLPVASDFTTDYNNIGNGRIIGTATTTGYSTSDATTNEIVIGFPAGTTSAQNYQFTGMYYVK